MMWATISATAWQSPEGTNRSTGWLSHRSDNVIADPIADKPDLHV